MKKLILVLTLIAGIIYLSANVIYTYKLEAPDIITENNVIKVKMAGAQSYGNPGAPNLPWFGSKLLLPIGEEAIDIQISLSGAKTFYLDKKVAPIQPPAILSKMDKIQKIEADPEIYNRSDSYPTQKHNGNNTQYLSGHPINFTAICPFDYNPMEDKLTFYSQITVTVVTGSSPKANEARRLLKQDVDIAERLTNTIDNPEAIPRYEERLVGYDYLIIYDQLKLTQWLLFKTLYEDRGFNVYMKPIQEIIAESTGIDTQEKIRNYITNFYSQQPLKYVLLAGDTDLIPHRGFYVNMGSEGEVDEDIPADMYYSCLDGNWNTDNDSYWGEPMETDLVPELSIGRYCYNSDEEIANFINKTSMYLNNPVIPEIKSAFFVGEYLWEGPTWGGDYMDEMIGGSSANGYTTTGVPTNWDITTLYDRTYGYSDAWGAAEIRPLLSEGPNFVNHLGHSSTTYAMRLGVNQVTPTTITNNGTNHNFSIIFTQGCYAGAFDNRETYPGSYTMDSITEKFTSISTAAVAMVAHSRYGWGVSGSTDGASQYIHRQFIDAIFGEGIYPLGKALDDSKIDNIPWITNTPVMYWVTYETNLIGDPALMAWTDTPQQIIAELPSYWIVGLNYYQIQTNAPNALFRLKNGGDLICETTADASGLITITLLGNLTPGTLDAYMIAPNFLSFHQEVVVQASNMPYIVPTTIDILDNDDLYHTGEEIDINATVKNVGLIDQMGQGTITLISNSSNILVLSDSAQFNPLAVSDSTVIAGVFRIRIQGYFPDHQIATLNFLTTFDGYSATTPFIITLNAPELNIDSYNFVNESPLIMPGDQPYLNMMISNSGSGNAYSPMLVLFCDDPNVILSDSEAYLPSVSAGNIMFCENVFNVYITNAVSPGTAINIGYMLTAENGNTVEGNFVLYVGNQHYTYENDFTGWSMFAPLPNFVNQWHRENYRNHTTNGSWSMKFGGIENTNYVNSAYGFLESPELPLVLNAQLHFFHWIQAENHTNNPQYAWDGGLVQMSLNGGEWTQIYPVGGYPYKIYNNVASPFPAETRVYSGTFDWSEAVFNLSEYTGTAKFRFIFGSDGAVTKEGWYIDDLYMENEVPNSDLVETIHFELYENYPNPFNPTTTISFNLPKNAPVNLEIFNLKGQKVRTLINSELKAGKHNIIWNGLDNDGKQVASGVYFYRLSNGEQILTHKMMLMK